jgi:hypothetical protein
MDEKTEASWMGSAQGLQHTGSRRSCMNIGSQDWPRRLHYHSEVVCPQVPSGSALYLFVATTTLKEPLKAGSTLYLENCLFGAGEGGVVGLNSRS